MVTRFGSWGVVAKKRSEKAQGPNCPPIKIFLRNFAFLFEGNNSSIHSVDPRELLLLISFNSQKNFYDFEEKQNPWRLRVRDVKRGSFFLFFFYKEIVIYPNYFNPYCRPCCLVAPDKLYHDERFPIVWRTETINHYLNEQFLSLQFFKSNE